jgi:hypothetical protein
MLDFTKEIIRSYLIPAQTATATVTGASLDLANTDTGDILALTLFAVGVTGTTPTLNVKLQDSANNSTWADVVATALMPLVAFVPVTATLANPVVMAIDPRAVRRYIRLVATIGGTTPSYTFGVDLERRPIQTGFTTTSG